MENISVSVPNNAKGAAILRGIAAMLVAEGMAGTTAAPASKPAAAAAAPAGAPAGEKKKGGRPTKEEVARRAAAAAAAAAPAEDDGLGDDVSEADIVSEDDGLGEDFEPEPEAAAKPKFTLEGHVLPAFQDYAKRHGRPGALKLLEKLGVKSVRDIDASTYGDVLRMLKK